jgi:hypothetical protein
MGEPRVPPDAENPAYRPANEKASGTGIFYACRLAGDLSGSLAAGRRRSPWNCSAIHSVRVGLERLAPGALNVRIVPRSTRRVRRDQRGHQQRNLLRAELDPWSSSPGNRVMIRHVPAAGRLKRTR